MTNISVAAIVPKNAIPFITAPEYSAWRTEDGSEAWIDMREPETAVSDAIFVSVLEAIRLAGGKPKKVTVANSSHLGSFGKPVKNEGHAIVDVYVSEFATVDVISLAHTLTPFTSDERRYEQDGMTYVFRDQYQVDENGNRHGRIQVQYATKHEDGNTVWKPCREGVNFSEVEPFEAVA
ncbi:hypothetical protein [Mycoplana ramosa]|uniref:Uncharacterized protein n=1 Tax=Mycoplana ramosa TaxID=40837 RepID=A0ABW3YQ88_MYCRA